MGKVSTKIATTLCLLGIVAGITVSCNTQTVDEVVRIAQNTPPPNNPPQGNPGPYPQYGDAHAVLVATKTKTTAFGNIIRFGTAVAVFFQSPGVPAFVEAGSVKVEGEELDLMENKSYAYVPDLKTSTVFEGIEFLNPIMWNVTGAGSVTGFNHGLTGNFPDADTISSGLVVNKNGSYTLKVGSVLYADSVLFNIGSGNDKKVYKTLPGNAKTCTFTAAEMADLTPGVGIVQVAAYRVTSAVYSGRKNYFIRETVSSQTVEIKD
jgi:hypothetical protein